MDAMISTPLDAGENEEASLGAGWPSGSTGPEGNGLERRGC